MPRLFLILLLALPCWATTDYANEGGSGDRRRYIIATVSGSTVAGCAADRLTNQLIDGTTTGTGCYFSGGDATGRWIQFDFGEARIVDEATFTQSSATSHATVKWQGTNNYSDYTDIGSTFTLGMTAVQVQTQLNGNTTAYRALRLLVTTGTNSGSPYIFEFTFKITPRTASTVWTHALSSGDRTASITTAATAGLFNSAVTNLIDGVNTSGANYFQNGTAATKYLSWDFGSSVVVDFAACYYQYQSAAAQGVWKFQGSADGATWADIGISFTLLGTAVLINPLNALSGNTTGYRYLQLLGVSGNTSAGPLVYEFEFRIADYVPPSTSRRRVIVY